jgi:transposase
MDSSSSSRRIVGLDLGVATAHTAQVLDEQLAGGLQAAGGPDRGRVHRARAGRARRRRCGTRLEVVIEPTGAAWLPVAVWFTRRGHTVFRVSTQKAHDLRKFLSRHAKSNSIDAHTLARLPLIDPDGLYPVHLPDSRERRRRWTGGCVPRPG